MKSREWQKKAKALEKELRELTTFDPHHSARSTKSLRENHTQIELMKRSIEGHMEAVEAFGKRRSFLTRNDLSLIQWSKEYVKKVLLLFEMHSKYERLSLWFRLLQNTIGCSMKKGDASPEVVERLDHYRAKQQKTLRYLEGRQLQVTKQSQALQVQYHQLVVATNMREAAGSLHTALGMDVTTALHNPVLVAFQYILLRHAASIDSQQRSWATQMSKISCTVSPRRVSVGDIKDPSSFDHQNIAKKFDSFERSWW